MSSEGPNDGQPDRLRRIEGTTRTVGVIGWPVEHSLSPVIHNAAFAALGMDWVYVPLPTAPGRVEAALEGLAALGFAGANVTMPHKTECADLIADLSGDARALRAVNTIVVGAEALVGHNSDVLGFERFLAVDAGFDPSGRTALLFGAGGAARACALALARSGLAALTVAVREPTRAEPLRALVEPFGTDVTSVGFDDASGASANLVVNATPLGARGEPLPLPPLDPAGLAVDLLTRPGSTSLLTEARRAGCASFGGVGLLLHQGAIAFELWTGRAPPLDVMSAAALAELSEPGSTIGS
ncbi:MAG TPA: shikimate dehydrogenase [Actinomycetota bacterium]|nr:shikimate dehydrogenase [Actinomycetota bacterium]